MFINKKLGEIHLKIVYYGPSLSGKTTNLQYIHSRVNPELRGELISLKTSEDRTIYFDFLQIELGKILGLKPKFSLYTVPGQPYYEASRRLVLNGADGVVFVADAQRYRMVENLDNLKSLAKHLRQMSNESASFPFVLQVNKQDLPDIWTPEQLAMHLGTNGVPCFGSVATHGEGVFETLKAIINIVIQRIH
ncbi:MAG: gliding-motility protein MglA [Chloroflexi bacterium]|nr:gliding-motility protein MglA [Chloroflexota bacterium]